MTTVLLSAKLSNMSWKVEFTAKSSKQIRRLPRKIQEISATLIEDIILNGPVRNNWKNFSKLEKNVYHCHLKKGKPTYVACWEIVDKKVKIIEVYYVGTHEKAPY